MDRLVETRHIAASDFREVTLQAAGRQQHHDDAWLFLPQTAGGSISLPSRDARQLHWYLQSHTTTTLSLADVSISSGQVGRGLQINLPDQAFPAVAAHIDSTAGSLYLFLLLASKSVVMLRLLLPDTAAAAAGAAAGGRQQAAAQRSSLSTGGGNSSSILDALARSIAQGIDSRTRSCAVMHLGQELAAVGLPSALAAAEGHLCITGSTGTVSCMPIAALASGQGRSPVVHLNPNNLVAAVKRRMGFAVCAAAVAAVPVDLPSVRHHSLLVLHQDTSCHQWFVGQQRQGLSTTLVSDAAVRQLRPNRVLLCTHPHHQQPQQRHRQQRLEQNQPPWDALLVFDLGVADLGAQSDVRVLPLQLQQMDPQRPGGGPVPARKLEPVLPQPQQLQLEAPDASLVDAQVVGQQLLLLLRSASSGGTYVVCYTTKDWSYGGRCRLLQHKAPGWGGHEELWSAALSAFPDAIDPASHVLSQLLVPGQLCGSSLRAAVSYFGAQLSDADIAEATLSQLQARIRAAVEVIQARNPSFSPARCWHTLFAKYCELWQEQHALLGLWAGPGGWVGGVRAGGVLSVLRPLCPAEKLGQANTVAAVNGAIQAVGLSGRSGIPGEAPAAAKVRLCLDAIGQIMGQPALRVMTQLVMAGVPVEGQLLPAFVQLLLQGPPPAPAAAASGFGSNGSSGASKGLAEWRLRRQALLLSVHEQLGELDHVLEVLSGVVDLTIKTATLAAGQLQAPPDASAAAAGGPSSAAGAQPPLVVGSLVSTVALHSLRASCSSLQQLLLLLGCISQLGSLGSVPLTADEQASIAADLISPLATALRSAAVALWLCKTPASAPVAGAATGVSKSAGLPGLPLLGLRGGTPSSSAASTPREAAGPGTTAGPASPSSSPPSTAASKAVWRLPLAAHLLPLFWRQQGSMLPPAAAVGSSLGTLGDQLAVWLMLGAGAGSLAAAAAAAGGGAPATSLAGQDGAGSVGPWMAAITGKPWGVAERAVAADKAVASSAGLAGRAVLLGFQLFLAREYGAMQRLVRLVAGDSPSEAGLQFILGLSIACAMRQSRKAAAAAAAAVAAAGAGLLSGSSPARGGLGGAATATGSGGDQQQLRLPGGSAASAAQLDSAVGHLFRAAAGLCGQEAGPLRLVLQLLRQQQGNEAKGAAAGGAGGGSSAMDTDTVGDGGEQAGQAAVAVLQQRQQQEGAALRLQFAQAVMMLFEQTGVKEGALAFARAALGAVDEAYGAGQAEERQQQQAMLWGSIFNFAFDLGLTQDAYTAALSNPRHETAERDVRRLVLALVEQGELQQLLSLPWSGVLRLKRDGLVVPVPVVEVVIDRLETRAVYGDFTGALQQPGSSAYHVLYDFLVTWGSYKQAAAAMLAYARHLRATPATSFPAGSRQQLQWVGAEVQAAYDTCVTLLQTLSPGDAWLDPNQRLLASFPAPLPATSGGAATVNRLTAASAAAGAAGGSPFDAGSSKTAARTAAASNQQQQQQQARLPAVLMLADVVREAGLFTAAAALQHKLPGLDIMHYELTADYAYEQLLGQEMLPEALRLAHVMWRGQRLVEQLELAAAAVAAACAELQQGSGLLQQQEGADDLMAMGGEEGLGAAAGPLASCLLSFRGPRYLGSKAAVAWTKLRQLLELYDSFDCLAPGAAGADGSSSSDGGGCVTVVGGRMRLAAVDGILRAQPRISLPSWLLQPFMPTEDDDSAAATAGAGQDSSSGGGMAGQAADPAALLRTYMQHGRLIDAAQLVAAHLDAWQRRPVLQRKQPAAVWLPLLDLQLLYASLISGAERAREAEAFREAELLGQYAELLSEGFKSHVDLAKQDSVQLASGASAGHGHGGGLQGGGHGPKLLAGSAPVGFMMA